MTNNYINYAIGTNKMRKKKITDMYYLHMQEIFSKKLSERDKKQISKVVDRVIDEYGEVIRMLS